MVAAVGGKITLKRSERNKLTIILQMSNNNAPLSLSFGHQKILVAVMDLYVHGTHFHLDIIMNKKRNISYIKPEDPEFLKVLKRQAGYDDKNHKFDELMNNEEDFVEDEDSELPQVVVLKEGDLTAEEAEKERERLEKLESETKADLSQRVMFKTKEKPLAESGPKRKQDASKTKTSKEKKSRPILSFNDDEDENDVS